MMLAIRKRMTTPPLLRACPSVLFGAAFLFAAAACGDSEPTDPYQDAAGVFLLESIAGADLPALISSTPREGDVEVTTGSLFLSSDRRFQETMTVRHTRPDGAAQNGTALATGTYTIVGDSVEFSLLENGLPTETRVQARLRGDTLTYEVFGRLVLYLKI